MFLNVWTKRKEADIEKMRDTREEVTYKTLVENVNESDLKTVKTRMGYVNEKHLTLENSLNVRYFKSMFKNNPCFFIEQDVMRQDPTQYIFIMKENKPLSFPCTDFDKLPKTTDSHILVFCRPASKRQESKAFPLTFYHNGEDYFSEGCLFTMEEVKEDGYEFISWSPITLPDE